MKPKIYVDLMYDADQRRVFLVTKCVNFCNRLPGDVLDAPTLKDYVDMDYVDVIINQCGDSKK